ncbi:DUF2637 domain-containing protein [Prauserella alba]|uniref:DUF2637 domain-containing protein n=1 Tax=Prauserella alba TaxID=176898 RepID=A0ABN1VF76_9PSEU|nr:DUF2637 domain-containing protein [Prauserella alba]MCP2180029.1 Protein of unknown function (DUF2637) [Prauserella alba]
MSTPTHQPSIAMQRINLAAVGVVAVVAAVISYAHMQDLAHGAGEGWRSHLLPLSVDGLLVAATTSILVARWRRQSAHWVAQVSLALGIAASIAANIAAAEPTLTGRLVAAWPPLALALATELLAQQGRRTDTETATTDQNEPPAAEPAEPVAPEEAPTTDAPAEAPRTETDPAAVEAAPRVDDAPRRATATPRRAARPTTSARTGNGDAREKARALFEQARAAGRADEVTGTQLAEASGAHPGTARKWLATWRTEHADTTTDPRDEHTDPTQAEEVAA